MLPSQYFRSQPVSASEFDDMLREEGIRRFSLTLISGRCGSTYLASMARQCGLGSGEEPFKEMPLERWQAEVDPANFSGYLRHVMRDYRCGDTLHIQITPQRLAALFSLIPIQIFDRRPVSAVFRRDLLAQGLSYKYAMRTGLWHSNREPIGPETPEFQDDALELIRCIWIALEGEDQSFGILSAPLRAYFYEDIVREPHKVLTDFLDWHEYPTTSAEVTAAITGKGHPAKLEKSDFDEQYERALEGLPILHRVLELRRSTDRWGEARKILLAEVRDRLAAARGL